MKASTILALLSTIALATGRPARPYSIVNVDGQGAQPAAPTKTASPQDIPAAEPAAAQPPPATVTQAPVQSQATPATDAVVSTPVVTQPSSTQAIVVTITTTATPSPTSVEYYDDGMWHTRYAKKPETTGAPLRANSTVPAAKFRRTVNLVRK